MDQLCNGHLQHAKFFIYGRFGNDAKLTLCETELIKAMASPVESS
jgi:hypothetical protein